MKAETRKRHSVLAAVDFSAESREAVRAARSMASASGSSLTVAHVRPYSDIRAAVHEDRGDLLKKNPQDLRKAVADHYSHRLAGMIREAQGERLVLLRGKPSFALCREAGRNHDFLVMGSRGRGGVAATLLGSTVQEVLARCTVPVVVVPARATGARQRRRVASRHKS